MFKLILFLFILNSITVFHAQGYICAVGGGSEDYDSWSDDPYSWIVKNSDSGKISILSYSDQDNWLVDYFLSFGASEVENLKIPSVQTADSESVYDKIISSKAVFIKGGDQWKYISYWKGTKTEDAIRELYNSGGVVAGTSAGAMILSEIVFSAQNGSIDPRQTIINPLSSEVALDDDFIKLFPNSIFDTHFIERGRFARLIGMMYNYYHKTSRKILGIGIDDKTALCISPDNIGIIYGSGAVSIFEFDSQTSIKTENNQYYIDNLLCNRLTQEWEYDFNKNIVSKLPKSAREIDNSLIIELSKTDIYLTGNTDNKISYFPDLDFFIENANTSSIGIIADSGSEDYQFSLINELQKLNEIYSLILIDPDSLNNESLNRKILESTSYIINAENYIIPAMLNDTTTLLGRSFNSKIYDGSAVLLLGNNGKIAGEKFVYNTDLNNLASYKGLMKLSSGLDLFGDLIFQPMLFADPDFYENRTSALTYGMMRGRKKIGLYLDFDSRAKIDSKTKTIFAEGTSPLIIIDSRNTTFIDSSHFTLSGGASNRQVVGMNNLRYTIAKFDKIYDIERGLITSIKTDLKNSKSFHRLIELFPNYPNPFNSITNISFMVNKAADVKLTLYNSLGEKIRTFAQLKASPGLNRLQFNIGNFSTYLSSGIYYIAVESGNINTFQKIVYLK